MYPRSCRTYLLIAALAFFPLLTQADPLNNGALGVLGLIPLVLLGLASVTVGLVFWAYLRPTARGVYWGQLLLLSSCLCLGLLQERFFPNDLPLLNGANPLLQVCVPLGLWLNGVAWARGARRESAGLLGLAVAVLALLALLMAVPSALLTRLYQQAGQHGQAPPAMLLAGYRLLAFGISVGSWWVVLRQVVRTPALNARFAHPWWRAPAVAAVVDGVYFGLHMAFVFGAHGGLGASMPWGQLVQAGLTGVMFTWGAGAVAFRLPRPHQHTPPEPAHSTEIPNRNTPL